MSLFCLQILVDAAKVLGVTERNVFDLAATYTEGKHCVNRAKRKWYNHDILETWVEDFALDVLAGRLALPKQPGSLKPNSCDLESDANC